MANEFYVNQPDYIAKLNELWQLALQGGGGGGGGTVLTVTGTAPVDVTGTATDRVVSMAAATAAVNGYMTMAYAAKLNNIADNANNYSLPTATASVLGGIKVGTNLSIDVNGVLSASTGGGPVAFNSQYATGVGPSVADTEITVGTVTLTSVGVGVPVLIVARANFLKDTGTTVREVTVRVRRGSLNTDPQVGGDSKVFSQNVASTAFGPGVVIAQDSGHGGGSVTYTVRAVVSVAATVTTPAYDIEAIELKATKGDTGPQGLQGDPGATGATGATGAPGEVTFLGVQTLENKTLTNPAFTKQTLADAASITWNASFGSWADVTITANRTIAAPTNLKVGVYVLYIKQGGAGGFTITTWDPIFKFTNNQTPVLSTAPGLVDSLLFLFDGTTLNGGVWVKGATGTVDPPPGPSATYFWGANLSGMEWVDTAPLRTSVNTAPNINFTVPRPEDVQHLASSGMTKSRLLIQWEMLQPIRASSPANSTVRAGYGIASNGEFYAIYANYITAVLDAHSAAGMKCIIELHNFCRYKDFIYNGDGSVTGFTDPADPLVQPYTTDSTKVRTAIMSKHVNTTITIGDFQDFWTRCALQWKDHPGFGGYGLMYKPNNMPAPGGSTPWNDPFVQGNTEDFTIWPLFAQRAIEAIRTIDANGAIYVSGNSWSSVIGWSSQNPGYPLIGSNLIYEGYMSLDAFSSGHSFSYDDEVARNFSAGEAAGTAIHANTGVNRLAGWISWLAANSAKGALAEFGMPLHRKTDGTIDDRWFTMYRNSLTSLHNNNIELYAWRGGAHWTIHSHPTNQAPQWHQNRTLDPRVSGEMKAKKAINTYAIFDDGPGYGLPADGAKTITVYARGYLPSNVVLTLATDNGGTFSGSTVTLLAGPNPSATYTYTPASDRLATITYSGSAQVPPPRKFYSFIDPVAQASTNLANGANALIAKYAAAKWVMADAHRDYIGTGLMVPATNGQNIKAVADTGYASKMDDPMEMLYWLNAGSNMGVQIPGVMATDGNSKKYLDVGAADSRGLWCKKTKPSAFGDINPTSHPRPAGEVPYKLNTPHFMIAAIRIPSTSTSGVIFQNSEAQSNCKSELVLTNGVPELRLRDKKGDNNSANQTLTVTASSGVLAINLPKVVSAKVKIGTQKLRHESTEVGAGALTPDDQVYASTYNSRPFFNQMLIAAGYDNQTPAASFRGGVYAVIAGPGDPTDAEMNVMEAYLSNLGGGTLALGGGGGGGSWPADAFAGGEQGLWYEPDDITTLKKTDQTTQVDAYGQEVGRMLDKSGRANYLTETTAGHYPVYDTRNSKDTLTTFAVADIPGTAGGPGGSTTGFFFCLTMERSGWFWSHGVIVTDKDTANVGVEIGFDGSNFPFVSFGTGSGRTTLTSTTEFNTGVHTLMVWYDSTNFNIQVDNASVQSVACAGITAGSLAQSFFGAYGTTYTDVVEGYVFAVVQVKNSTLTDTQRASIKTYCGGKGGQTL